VETTEDAAQGKVVNGTGEVVGRHAELHDGDLATQGMR